MSIFSSPPKKRREGALQIGKVVTKRQRAIRYDMTIDRFVGAEPGGRAGFRKESDYGSRLARGFGIMSGDDE
jgi:hypothetical protein